MEREYTCNNRDCRGYMHRYSEAAFFRCEGRCIECESELVVYDPGLLSSADIWQEDLIERLPCVLAHEYARLKKLCELKNYYGAFVQTKDVIEATVKCAVLVTSAWGKVHEVPGRIESYEKELVSKKLSLAVQPGGVVLSF